MHLHRNMLVWHHYGRDVLGIGAGDRVFATSRLSFSYALGNAFLIPLASGATVYLHPAWPEPAGVAALLRSFRPTVFFSVPTFYSRLLRAELPADAFRSLRYGVSAGQRLPPRFSERSASALASRSWTPWGHQRNAIHASPRTTQDGVGPAPPAFRFRARTRNCLTAKAWRYRPAPPGAARAFAIHVRVLLELRRALA